MGSRPDRPRLTRRRRPGRTSRRARRPPVLAPTVPWGMALPLRILALAGRSSTPPIRSPAPAVVSLRLPAPPPGRPIPPPAHPVPPPAHRVPPPAHPAQPQVRLPPALSAPPPARPAPPVPLAHPGWARARLLPPPTLPGWARPLPRPTRPGWARALPVPPLPGWARALPLPPRTLPGWARALPVPPLGPGLAGMGRPAPRPALPARPRPVRPPQQPGPCCIQRRTRRGLSRCTGRCRDRECPRATRTWTSRSLGAATAAVPHPHRTSPRPVPPRPAASEQVPRCRTRRSGPLTTRR